MDTVILFMIGLVIIVLIITGPTLWHDWQEERARKRGS